MSPITRVERANAWASASLVCTTLANHFGLTFIERTTVWKVFERAAICPFSARNEKTWSTYQYSMKYGRDIADPGRPIWELATHANRSSSMALPRSW